ncbi:MAG: hypothetical protein RL711_1053 [Bacteroidota bacterium]|jgi:hypothetical protein
MIQRLQSILLAGVVLSMITLLFVPIWHKESPSTKEQVTVTAFAIKSDLKTGSAEKPLLLIGALAIAAAGIAGYSIFQYKKRTLQLLLGIVNSLVLMGVLGAMWYCVQFDASTILTTKDPAKFGLGFFMPAISMILNMLSSRFIRRDEKLVSSADRLR